jgi:hypothetical protein
VSPHRPVAAGREVHRGILQIPRRHRWPSMVRVGCALGVSSASRVERRLPRRRSRDGTAQAAARFGTAAVRPHGRF